MVSVDGIGVSISTTGDDVVNRAMVSGSAAERLAAGLDDLSLSRIMGHSSVVVTRDRYGHVRPDRIAEVAETLDADYEHVGR